MKNILSKQTRYSYAACGATLAVVIGFIIYLVNSLTGYLAGTSLDPLVITFSILAMVCGLAMFFVGDKLKKFAGLGYFAMGVFITVAISTFMLSRQEIAADLFFIPVNHPVEEEATFTGSVIALVFYFLAFIAVVYSTFGEKPFKSEEAVAA